MTNAIWAYLDTKIPSLGSFSMIGEGIHGNIRFVLARKRDMPSRLSDNHHHPLTHRSVRGYRLEAGDTLHDGDCYDSSAGTWEPGPMGVFGLVLGEGTTTIWIRPEAPIVDSADPNFSTRWSPDDAEFVGLYRPYPSLSFLAASPHEALVGIKQLVMDVRADLYAETEPKHELA